MALHNIVLVGAGGNLGPVVLQALLDAKFNVTVLSRASSSATFPAGVAVARVPDDYPSDALETAFRGQDAVVCVSGQLPLATQTRLIDAAAAAGVHRFLPPEFGSLPEPAEATHGPFAEKLAVRQYLQNTGDRGMTWTALVNSAFFDWGLEVGFLRVDIPGRKATVLGDGNQPWHSTTLRAVAAAVVGVLQRPDETRNRIVRVDSFAITQNQLIAAVEHSIGEKLPVEHLDATTWVAEQEAKAAKGDVGSSYGLIWAYITLGKDQWAGKLDNELLNVPREDLQTVVDGVVKKVSSK